MIDGNSLATYAARQIGRVLLVVLILGLALGALIALTALAPSRAAAHEAVSGWAYDRNCCSDEDCARVSARLVRTTPEGWLLSVEPGDHPFVKSPRTYLVPYGARKERVSGDTEFHACISRHSNHLYCLYVPGMAT